MAGSISLHEVKELQKKLMTPRLRARKTMCAYSLANTFECVKGPLAVFANRNLSKSLRNADVPINRSGKAAHKSPKECGMLVVSHTQLE